ncbi:uncharacterized protein FA14DRAFT_126304 [Meira miltonrushii]|uniref:Uncharacterized protein n=1 Tax=Meira miltonrushii TaxID=1280837 RepID=A0A316V6J8_9BASI|nr:uncharacterized protein FA14DRAFT_126304 [Meira miltonrushii]PWN32658.1 hypothetical protein FA14DRAFT_126304 [Meira miltonrushii]
MGVINTETISRTRLRGGRHQDHFDIVPIPVLDATTGNIDIQTRITFLFDKQLDLTHIKEAWYQLVEAWPFLSAQVRECKEAQSGLAYHIPKEDVLKEHSPLEAFLPKNQRQFLSIDCSNRSLQSYWPGGADRLQGDLSETPFICDSPSSQEEQDMTSHNAIRTFDELIKSDRPIFTAQATLFSDATMISLSFAHIIGDGFCIKNIFTAWTDVIRGVQPPPQPAILRDNFASIDVNAKPNLPLRYRLLGLRDKVKLMANMLYDLQFGRPEKSMQAKYIHLPGTYVSQLQKEANEYLQSSPANPPNHFVSRSDIVLAFIVKNIAATNDPSKSLTPITIANARGKKVTGINLDFSHALGGCAVALPLTGMPAGELVKMPLAELASQIHQDIVQQTSSDNLRDLFAFNLHHFSWKRVHGPDAKQAKAKSDGKMPFFCTPNGRFCGLTDWRALGFGQVNFKGAALSGECESAKVKAINTHMITPFSTRDRFACLGDLDGSVWLYGVLSKAEWEHKDGFGRLAKVSRNTEKAPVPVQSEILSSRL